VIFSSIATPPRMIFIGNYKYHFIIAAEIKKP